MEWQTEKMCSSKGNYDLLVERFKHNYHCEQGIESWKWRVIHGGVVMAQGTTTDVDTACQMAEANVPSNQ